MRTKISAERGRLRPVRRQSPAGSESLPLPPLNLSLIQTAAAAPIPDQNTDPGQPEPRPLPVSQKLTSTGEQEVAFSMWIIPDTGSFSQCRVNGLS